MKAHVGFVAAEDSGNFGHKWIRRFQGAGFNPYSRYVHMFIVYEPGSESAHATFIHETTETVYHQRWLKERVSGTKCDFFALEGDPIAALEFTTSLLGEKYGYIDIAWFGFDCSLEWAANIGNIATKKDWVMQTPRVNPWNTSNHFCAEASVEAMGKMGSPVPPYPPSGIKPPFAYKWCEDNLTRSDPSL